jgi:hypothetical protein
MLPRFGVDLLTTHLTQRQGYTAVYDELRVVRGHQAIRRDLGKIAMNNPKGRNSDPLLDSDMLIRHPQSTSLYRSSVQRFS